MMNGKIATLWACFVGWSVLACSVVREGKPASSDAGDGGEEANAETEGLGGHAAVLGDAGSSSGASVGAARGDAGSSNGIAGPAEPLSADVDPSRISEFRGCALAQAGICLVPITRTKDEVCT